MPRNIYEIMYILDTSKVAGDLPTAVTALHGTLEKRGAPVPRLVCACAATASANTTVSRHL